MIFSKSVILTKIYAPNTYSFGFQERADVLGELQIGGAATCRLTVHHHYDWHKICKINFEI